MEFLVLWTLYDGVNMMTVQAQPQQCVQMAASVHELRDSGDVRGKGVENAICTRSEKVIDGFIERNECNALEVRDGFVNFICKRRYHR